MPLAIWRKVAFFVPDTFDKLNNFFVRKTEKSFCSTSSTKKLWWSSKKTLFVFFPFVKLFSLTFFFLLFTSREGKSDSNFIISQFLNTTPRCLFMLFLLLSLLFFCHEPFVLLLLLFLLPLTMIRQGFNLQTLLLLCFVRLQRMKKRKVVSIQTFHRLYNDLLSAIFHP